MSILSLEVSLQKTNVMIEIARSRGNKIGRLTEKRRTIKRKLALLRREELRSYRAFNRMFN